MSLELKGFFEHADGRCLFDMRLYVTVKDAVDIKKKACSMLPVSMFICCESIFDKQKNIKFISFLVETCMARALLALCLEFHLPAKL